MIEVCSLNTNYLDCGSGEVVLFLHGWGSDISDFQGSFNHFKNNYRTINLDLWGFGKSEEPHSVWGTKEYANAVYEFVKNLGLKNIHLVGHSFGGKVAILYTYFHSENLKSLTLVDSAGIKPKLTCGTKLKIKRYKKLKSLVESGKKELSCLEKFGSTDFKQSCGIMQKILTRVVNEDIEKESKEIKVKTQIIWGKKDKDTPLYMAKQLHKNIQGSNLYVLNGGHFSHIDSFVQFNGILEKFWRSL